MPALFPVPLIRTEADDGEVSIEEYLLFIGKELEEAVLSTKHKKKKHQDRTVHPAKPTQYVGYSGEAGWEANQLYPLQQHLNCRKSRGRRKTQPSLTRDNGQRIIEFTCNRNLKCLSTCSPVWKINLGSVFSRWLNTTKFTTLSCQNEQLSFTCIYTEVHHQYSNHYLVGMRFRHRAAPTGQRRFPQRLNLLLKSSTMKQWLQIMSQW